MTSDGKPYAPFKYKEIVRERYFISRITHTSYNDVGKITPIERQYLIDFILEDKKKEEELFQKKQAEFMNRR